MTDEQLLGIVAEMTPTQRLALRKLMDAEIERAHMEAYRRLIAANSAQLAEDAEIEAIAPGASTPALVTCLCFAGFVAVAGIALAVRGCR